MHARTAGLWLAVAMAGAALTTQAQAQDVAHGAVFTGGEIDHDDAGYAGAQIALPGSAVGRGWAVRGSVSGGVYQYSRDSTRIDGRFVGGQIGPIYQWSGGWGYADVGVAARFMSTDLSPDDRQNRRRGDIADALISIDGARVFGRWQATGYAEGGTDIRDYLVRASLTRRISPTVRIGPETILQGDPTYDRQRLGVLAGFAFNRLGEVQVSAGWSTQRGMSDHAYGTIAIVHSF